MVCVWLKTRGEGGPPSPLSRSDRWPDETVLLGSAPVVASSAPTCDRTGRSGRCERASPAINGVRPARRAITRPRSFVITGARLRLGGYYGRRSRSRNLVSRPHSRGGHVWSRLGLRFFTATTDNLWPRRICHMRNCGRGSFRRSTEDLELIQGTAHRPSPGAARGTEPRRDPRDRGGGLVAPHRS